MNLYLLIIGLGLVAALAVLAIININRCRVPRRKARLKTFRPAAAVALLALCAFADGLSAADTARAARTLDREFRAGEWGVDAGYLARTEDLQSFTGSTVLGANYFATRYTGLHAGGQFTDDRRGPFAEAIEFGLLGRLPVKTVALEFGLGAQFELKPDDWAVYAEAGPRWRIRRQIDLFAKVRGTRPIRGAEGENVALLAGAGTSW